MQPKKSLILLSLLIGALICTFSLGAVEAQFWGSQPEAAANDSPQHSDGMVNKFVVTPIRVVFNHAKALFGYSPMGNGNGKGVDPINQQTSYSTFMNFFNKSYSPEELPKRMALFAERSKKIQESIERFKQGLETFVMKINKFADWDDKELKMLSGVSLPSPDQLLPEERQVIDNRTPISVRGSIFGARNGSDLDNNDVDMMDENKLIVTQQELIPSKKDWRESGCIAAPLDQEDCGACYAVATMNVVESQRCINRRSSAILSPQQIVDCATTSRGYLNFGCNGGWPTRVFKYLQDVEMVAHENCYPFVKRESYCKDYRVNISSYGCGVPASSYGGKIRYKLLTNEKDILYHVAKTGPVVTAMKTTSKFLYYGKGIFNDYSCSDSRDDVSHAISIVGYGTENGVDYWIIKNSWGATWGEEGFGRYRRGRNVCSIGHWGWAITN